MTRTPTPKTDPQPQQPDLGPIEQIPIDLLKPYPGNARTHDDRQIAKLKQSLLVFKWMNPILAAKDGTIIAGHGRWLAAKNLGFTHCPVIRVEHLTPDQIRAYRLADNRLAELAGWDDETLRLELQHLSTIELDFNIEAIGWDHPEIDIILDPDGKDTGDPADQDVAPPEHSAITRVGDLWLLGKHRLLCGSALDNQSFVTLMNGEKAAMAFIDPPYNVPIAGHVSGLGKTKHREFVMASGEMSDAKFREFLEGGVKLLAENMVAGAVMAICMDWRSLLPLQLVVSELMLPVLNLAVWAKTNAGMGSLYRSQHELVLIVKKDKERHINNVELGKHGRHRTNVWRHAGVNSFGKGRLDLLKGHPTPKPIALVADVIRDVSHRGQIVLDSFIGSGTTLLAAERTKRIGYGMDLDPCYIDVTIRRWEKMTGQQAILAGSGQTFYEVAAERYGASSA